MEKGVRWKHWILGGVASLLAACGGGGGGSSGSTSLSLSGLAATGAGIANASVTAKCASGTPLSGTTDANGSYALVLDGRALPCMVQVTGGTPSVTLHSFAQAAGRVNITPVTDLIVAKALGADPAAAFTAYDATQGATVETGLNAAKTYVATQLSAITGASITDPLTGTFTVGDADDKVLDALGNALSAAGKTQADLRTQAQTGATLTGTVPAYLAAPTGLTASAGSSTAINLSWSAVPGATAYKVYRSTSTGVVVSGSAVGTSTSTSYSDAGLDPSTTYYYKVVPTNTVVTAGTASSETSASTSAASVTTSVTAFSPTSGAVGTSVTISGTGFDADPFHMQVKFSNNVAATVVSSTSTSVVVTVPAGAVTGTITVANTLTSTSATSASSFSVSAGGGGGGTTWTSRASPSAYVLAGLAYGGGKFVAVGYNRTILTSTDGISWTSRSAPDSNYTSTKSVAWTGSEFVLVGDMLSGGGNIPTVATSADGITWTRRAWTSSTSYDSVTAVGMGASKLMVGTQNGVLATSSDGGLNWTLESQSYISEFTGFAGSSSTRVAVGKDSGYNGVILYNSGSGWTLVSGISGFVPNDVVWTGSEFVAVGASGAGLGNAIIATSADGVSWTKRVLADTEIAAGFPLQAVLAHGGALYATADNLSNKHKILKSTDAGASWTPVHEATVSGNASLAGIAASADRVVTVGGVKSVTLP